MAEDGFFLRVGLLHPTYNEIIWIVRVASPVVGFARHFCKERLDILDLVVDQFLKLGTNSRRM